MTFSLSTKQLSRSSRIKYRRLTLLIVLILSSFALIYQFNGAGAEKYRVSETPTKRVQQLSAPCTHCKPPSEQTIYAPLFDLPEAASSEIVLNCRSPHEMTVTPTFYTIDGTPIVGDVIHLQPAEMRFVNTKSLIPASERNRHRWGGISFSYTGNSMEMWAQLTLHGIHGGGSASILFVVVNQQRSNTSEAIWLTPNGGESVIALGNSSDQPVHANLIFPNGDTRGADIAPFATEIVRLRSQGADQSSSKAGKVEAVSISYTGPAGSLIPAGITSSNDGKFTSMVRFYDTQNVAQPNLYANNLRLKDAAPRMVLRNTSAGVITARPKFLTNAGTPVDGVKLPAVRLEPYEVADVNLQPLMAAAKRTNLESVSVQVVSSDGAGSLIGALYSSNSKTGVIYDVPLRDYGPPRLSAGGYPVRLDGDYTTVLSITNVSDKAGRFTLQINYPGGAYTYEFIEISAGETKSFDVRKLRDEQTPDRDGHTLPRNMKTGQIRWSARGDGSVRMIGRAEVVSLTDGVSSSYSCGICCQNSFYDGTISPVEVDLFPGESQQFAASERQQDCYGNIFGPYDIGSMGSWDSSDTSIANVDFRGLATGVGGGFAEISCTWTADYWREDLNTMCEDYQEPYTEEAYPQVQVPSDISIVSYDILPTGTSGDYGCTPSENYGISVSIKYQVLDQNGGAIMRSGMLPQETITHAGFAGGPFSDPTPNWSNIGPTYISYSTTYTDANGQFYDVPFGTCGNGSFTFLKTQNISIVANNIRYVVRTQDANVTTSSQGHGHLFLQNGTITYLSAAR